MSEQGAAGQAQPADQGIGAAIDRALEALGQGEVNRARSLLEAAIALDPSHPAPATTWRSWSFVRDSSIALRPCSRSL